MEGGDAEVEPKKSVTLPTPFRRIEYTTETGGLERETAMNEETLFHEALARPPDERPAFLEQAWRVGQTSVPQSKRLAVHQARQRARQAARRSRSDRRFRAAACGTGARGETPRNPRSAAPGRGRTTDYPAGRFRHCHRGPLHAAREDRRGRHGRGLGRQADRTGEMQGRHSNSSRPGMDSRAVLPTLRARAASVAMMDHPNIAQMLDGGLILIRPRAL